MALSALRPWLWALAVASLLGCEQPGTLVQERPYKLLKPEGYDGSTPLPLVILLHGYMDTASGISRYFKLDTLVSPRNFFYTTPSGTVDSVGNRFWGATDACCNYEGSRVDDVAYLTAIVDDVIAHNKVDLDRVFIVGHSNGGFMANRMACELSTRVAAIVSLAGANWNDPARCATTAGVSVLQVHGDEDTNVAYDGGFRHGVPFPSAVMTVTGWGTRNHCTGALAPVGGQLDLDSSIAGSEAVISVYPSCPAGGAAELWTVKGGSHKPALQPAWPTLIFDWLMAHPKAR